MRIVLLSLLIGCHQDGPSIISGETHQLVLLEEQADGLYVEVNTSQDVRPQNESASPNVFMPSNLDFDKPTRPEVEAEEEEVFEPIPTLSADQVALGWYATNGVAVASDGSTGMLGMSGGNSCEYNPSGGYLSGADFTNQSCPDIPVEYDEQGRVMYVCNDDIGFWSSTWGDQRYSVSGLVDVVITSDAFVTIEENDGCYVSRRDHAGSVASVEVPSILCDTSPSIAVNEADDIVYMANGDVWAINDLGYRVIAEDAGDIIAFDTLHKSIVVAWNEGTEIGGMNNAGDMLWYSSIYGNVYDLIPVGETGAVFALVYEDTLAPGSFVAYDGGHGEVWGEVIAWDGVTDVSVASNASKMLVAISGAVYTYDIIIED